MGDEVIIPVRDGFNVVALKQATHPERIGGGASGASIERLRLPDGRHVVHKAISPSTDWMMRVTNDRGRAALLPAEGWMRQLPVGVEDAVIAVGHEGDTWHLYLEDLSRAFADRRKRDVVALADEAARRAGQMHRAYVGVDIPHLATITDLLCSTSPATLEREDDGSAFFAHARRGWERFADVAPADVADAVLRVDDDTWATALATRLRVGTCTLLHGDLHFGNMVFDGDRLVILDWSLATSGPAALDFVWFVDRLADMIDVDGDAWLRRFLERDDPEPDVDTLDVCCLAQLVVAGWEHGNRVTEGPEDRREFFRVWLEWWCSRARRGLTHITERG